jgi:threonyl-tRNA synthetase
MFLEKHYKAIEDAAKAVVSQSQTFHRLILTKEQALELFRHNPFKVSLISNKIADGAKVTAYKCGDLIDLCTGPHVPSTKMIKAFKVMKNSSAYWLGDAQNDSLQRIYGVSYPSKKELDEYIHFKEEAEKRDHRNIGRQQKLFDTHEYSPGSAFFYPHGMKVYEKLISMIKEQYRVRGY